MDKAERIARVLDKATSSLKADPELCLDVRAELQSHIDDTIDRYLAEGTSEADSLGRALAVFGPAEEVGKRLLEANRRRMKLRALARMAVRRALVPASILVAAILCVQLWHRGEDILSVSKYPPAEPGALPCEPLKAAARGAAALPRWGPPSSGGSQRSISIWSSRRSSCSCRLMYSRITSSSRPKVETK